MTVSASGVRPLSALRYPHIGPWTAERVQTAPALAFAAGPVVTAQLKTNTMARKQKAPSTSAPPEPSRVAHPTAVAVPASTTSAADATSASAAARIKQRVPHSSRSGKEMPGDDVPMADYAPVDGGGPDGDGVPVKAHAAARNKWIVLAIASGACAAFNGVFAKLWVFFSV